MRLKCDSVVINEYEWRLYVVIRALFILLPCQMVIVCLANSFNVMVLLACHFLPTSIT